MRESLELLFLVLSGGMSVLLSARQDKLEFNVFELNTKDFLLL